MVELLAVKVARVVLRSRKGREIPTDSNCSKMCPIKSDRNYDKDILSDLRGKIQGLLKQINIRMKYCLK